VSCVGRKAFQTTELLVEQVNIKGSDIQILEIEEF
jgi:hypothetical protein